MKNSTCAQRLHYSCYLFSEIHIRFKVLYILSVYKKKIVFIKTHVLSLTCLKCPDRNIKKKKIQPFLRAHIYLGKFIFVITQKCTDIPFLALSLTQFKLKHLSFFIKKAIKLPGTYVGIAKNFSPTSRSHQCA